MLEDKCRTPRSNRGQPGACKNDDELEFDAARVHEKDGRQTPAHAAAERACGHRSRPFAPLSEWRFLFTIGVQEYETRNRIGAQNDVEGQHRPQRNGAGKVQHAAEDRTREQTAVGAGRSVAIKRAHLLPKQRIQILIGNGYGFPPPAAISRTVTLAAIPAPRRLPAVDILF